MEEEKKEVTDPTLQDSEVEESTEEEPEEEVSEEKDKDTESDEETEEEDINWEERALKAEDNYKAQKVRAEKAEANNKPKPKKEKSSAPKKDDTNQRLETLELSSAGVTDVEDQAWIKERARDLGITNLEFASKDHVKSELENRTSNRKSDTSMPPSSNTARTVKKTAKWFLDNQKLPEPSDPNYAKIMDGIEKEAIRQSGEEL